MNKDTVVYSVVTDNYDRVFSPKVRTKNVRYVLFSDELKEVKGWEIRPIFLKNKGGGGLTNRWHKFFPYKLFSDVEYSIYVDGNIRVVGDLEPLINEFKKSGAALGVFKHPDRENVFQEAKACLLQGKFDDLDKAKINLQLQVYGESEGCYPLTDNGIIFRWHRHPKLQEAMSLWWEHLQEFSKRDQISLPFVIRYINLSVKKWDWNFRCNENSFFEVYAHRHSLIRDVTTIIRIHKNEYLWASLIHRVLGKIKVALEWLCK